MLDRATYGVLMGAVQRMHGEIIARYGFPAPRCLVGNWPSPCLDTGNVAAPYCDNVSIIGLDKEAVSQDLRRLVAAFAAAGFTMHGISAASTVGTPLGCFFSGDTLEVGAKLDRAWALKQSLLWLACGQWVTGKQIERIIGHYVVGAFYERLGLSVFRAVYTFIRGSYVHPPPAALGISSTGVPNRRWTCSVVGSRYRTCLEH